MEEIWKIIPDYPNYKISNLGRVINIKKNKLMTLTKHNNYYWVKLSNNNHAKSIKVHRLVAQIFILNPDNLPCINHKDEDTSNNIVDNLEWCNHEYNNTYGTRIERQKEKIKKPVIQCDIKGNYINEFDSINDAANSLHILACNISNCLKGRQKSTPRGLYTWKYKF